MQLVVLTAELTGSLGESQGRYTLRTLVTVDGKHDQTGCESAASVVLQPYHAAVQAPLSSTGFECIYFGTTLSHHT